MKVMCIKNGLWDSSHLGLNTFGPAFGEIVTVLSIDGDGYWLKEWPTNKVGMPARWNKKNFVPLSTIDETELLKERESNLINI